MSALGDWLDKPVDTWPPCHWVFFGGDGLLLCKRCGDKYRIGMPVDLELLVAFGRMYGLKHSDCEATP